MAVTDATGEQTTSFYNISYDNSLQIANGNNEKTLAVLRNDLSNEYFTNKDESIIIEVYPNPSKTSTTFSFNLVQKDYVNAELYDMQGNSVFLIANNIYEKGYFEKHLDISNLSSGVYLYKVKTTGSIVNKRIVIQK